MKKFILCFVLAAAVPFYAMAQSMEFSFGLEGGFGRHTYDSSSFIPDDLSITGNDIILSARTDYHYDDAWGLGFLFRFNLPSNHHRISAGYMMRLNILAVTILEERLSGSMLENNVIIRFPTERQTRKLSMTSDSLGMLVSNVAVGSFYRIQLSNRFDLLVGPGLNFLFVDFWDWDNDIELNTLGLGFHLELALQFRITQQVYLEFGTNTTVNAFSSTRVRERTDGRWDESLIGGRFDGASFISHLHVGWRFNFD